MQDAKATPLFRYGIAFLSVFVATVVRFLLSSLLGEGVPFILYFPAIVVSAWFGGMGAGLWATVLSAIGAWFFFIPPYHSVVTPSPASVFQLGLFLLVAGFLCLVTRALQKAEGKARERREQLQVTLASIGDGVIATDSNGQVTFLNGVAESLTGWKLREAVGRPLPEIFRIINEQSRQEVENPALKAIREGAVVGLANHTLLLGKDGVERPIDDSGAPIKLGEHEIMGAVLVFRDVSARKRAEAAQQHLSAIITSSEDAIVSKTLEGCVTSWNRAAEHIFGYTAAEMIGQSITLIIPPERQAEEQMILDRLKRGERIEHYETVRRRKDGTLLDVSLTISPIKNSEGDIIGASKIARDITEQKRAETARTYLAAIVESSDDAIVGKTLEGVITSWNPAAERIFGYRAAEAIGQRIYLIIPSDRHSEEVYILDRLRRGQSIEHFETVRQRKDGTLIFVSLTISPIKDGTGRIIGASKIARDITAEKQAERAIGEGAERLSLALEAARLGDWSWDAATDVVTFSVRAAAIFGIPPGPHLTWTEMRELLHEEDRERARRAVEEAIAQHTDYAIEYRILLPGGEQRWVAATGRTTYDEAGQVKGMLGMVQDITERKLAAFHIEEEREALDTINQVGQMLSAELDLQKLVQALTDAATEITGARFGSFFYNVLDEKGASYMLYTLSGVPREHFAHFPMPRATDLFGPTFRGEGALRIDDVKQDPRYGKNAPYYGMPAGHLQVTSYLAVPVVSRSGEVLGGLFFGHPEAGRFTERHERIVAGLAGQAAIAMDNARLYEAAQRAREEAVTANRLKDEFLATVSHELRTPLNAILGWARLLRMGRLDEESRTRAVGTIEKSAVAQSQIIEDILDVSRIITGKLRLDVSPVEIAKIVEEAVESVRPTAEAKGVRVQAVLDTQSNPVLGDAHRLQQIMWNLLSNAIKFTPKGGRVQVTLARVNSYVEIAVSDTGQGISPAFLPYVFERFLQADSSTKRTYGGLGLGLAIVRHLTELHGGQVVAQSAGEGQGATFLLRLPLSIMREGANGLEAQLTPHRQRAVASDLPEALRQDLSGVRVLVVDDEADARELLRIALSQCGAEVRAAASVPEAFDSLRQWRPDVLVSDIGMPGEDGYELIRQVRSLPLEEGGGIPAAALTAYARSEDRLKALTSGFQMHVAKPVEPIELAAVVASLAGKTGLGWNNR